MIVQTAKVFEWARIVGESEIEVGHHSQIDDFVFINTGLECRLGRFVHIASFCSIIGGGRFIMEDFSGLSAGCRVITGSDDFTGGHMTNPTVPADFTHVRTGMVRICKHAVVGTNAVLFPGVVVGEGASVGAGCIVRKSLEPWTIYAGVNPRPVGRRDRDGILARERELRQKYQELWVEE